MMLLLCALRFTLVTVVFLPKAAETHCIAARKETLPYRSHIVVIEGRGMREALDLIPVFCTSSFSSLVASRLCTLSPVSRLPSPSLSPVSRLPTSLLFLCLRCLTFTCHLHPLPFAAR